MLKFLSKFSWSNFKENWRSSVTGIGLAVISILSVIGAINADKLTDVQGFFNQSVDWVAAGVTLIGAIIAAFRSVDPETVEAKVSLAVAMAKSGDVKAKAVK